MNNCDSNEDTESLIKIWNTQTIHRDAQQKKYPDVLSKILTDRNHFWAALQKSFAVQCVKLSNITQKIYQGIFQSDHWLNFYARNHIHIADFDDETRKLAFLILKNNNYFYRNFIAKILLFIEKDFCKKTTFENLRLISFANINLLFRLPITFFCLPQNDNLASVNHSGAEPQNVFSHFKSSSDADKVNFLADDKNDYHKVGNDNEEQIRQPIIQNSTSDTYYQHLTNTKKYINQWVQERFKSQYPAIQKVFTEIYQSEYFLNSLLDYNILSKFWIIFLNYQFSIIISFSFEILKNSPQNKKIIDVYIEIFKYALPMILIKKAISFYQQKQKILIKKNYYFNQKMQLVTKDNYQNMYNLYQILREKTVRNIRLHTNSARNQELMKQIFNFCKD